MLFASLALVMGAGLVGEDVKSVSAEENVYKTLDFATDVDAPDISSYTNSWETKSAEGDVYKIVNANNNKKVLNIVSIFN